MVEQLWWNNNGVRVMVQQYWWNSSGGTELWSCNGGIVVVEQ